MRPFKGFISIAIVLVLAGCTKPETKPDGVNGNEGSEGSASFRIASLEGDGKILEIPAPSYTTYTDKGSEKHASIWKVAREVNFRFTACITDRATQSSAIGHQFAVEIPETRQQIADIPLTTGSGCFSWFEPIPFSYFVKRSKWVILERDIIGTGIHTGRVRVKVAINPWAVGSSSRDSGDSVRFLRDKPLPPSLLVVAAKADEALSGASLGTDQVYIGDIDVQTIRLGEDSSGTLMRLNIKMQPKIRFENQEGVPGFRSIESGDFYVIAHLVLNNTGPGLNERVILSSPVESFDPNLAKGDDTARVIDGKLVARVSTWVRGRLPQGNLELVVKVIPKGVRGLTAAEGIYELGTFRNLSSHFSGDLNKECREDGNCDIANYLRKATNFEDLRERKYGANNSPYLFDRLNLRFAQVEPGETTTRRTVTYTASTCITDAFTGERPVGLPFVIRYNDTGEEIKDRKTEEDGCLRWSSSIFHKYYQPEQFIERTVTISKDSGFKREMKFFINPWDDKFTFGFDQREFTDKFWDDLKKRNKIPSRFFMADFGYHTVRFQYNIDSLMSLEVRKTVLMELDPRVLRYSGIINARKMTEPLRDGIWLMKVGIQKNYLDPAQVGIHIDALKEAQSVVDFSHTSPAGLKTPDDVTNVISMDKEVAKNPATKSDSNDERKNARQRLRKLGIEAPAREFITTQKALVRSTDGAIIQPVELTMQDLRMMRVRSNFLIELQPVDERQLQAENVLRGNFAKYLEEVNQKRKERRKADELKDSESFDQQKVWDEEDKRTNKIIEARRETTRLLFDQLSSQLRDSSASSLSWTPFELSEDQKKYFDETFKTSLRKNLETNDFTTIILPPCTEIDCDRFVEKGKDHIDPEKGFVRDVDDVAGGPGLVRRTFVGPVIFLSNGYKDSVRATDNLDEAQCGDKVQFEDDRERELDDYRRKLFSESDDKAAKVRQNTLYKFSEFFGSLRHLCGSHVDDLIAREKRYRYIYQANIPAVGSVYNYAQAYSMNFLSLSDEQPKSVDFSAESFQHCGDDLTKCMQPTTQFWVPVAKSLGWINSNLSLADGVFATVKSWVVGRRDVKVEPWTPEDLRRALFVEGKPSDTSSRRFAACSLLSANLASTLSENKAKVLAQDELGGFLYPKRYDVLQGEIMNSCLKNYADPISYDQKLRVFKTGDADDSYVFLGGYQMNINVGQSFSVGRSNSYSAGWGLEGTDFVGSAGGIMGGMAKLGMKELDDVAIKTGIASALVKPLSLKVGGGTSVSSSDGTSISESTYLVAQIAKFRVRLDDYERCAVLNFTANFMHTLETVSIYAYKPDHGALRSLLVCEGKHQEKPRYVDEMYFYFTQHFTEGDMLDQADLYNHPWLLALRGNRDFGSFVALIRKQDQISFWDMVGNAISPTQRSMDWPLAHMREAYKKIVPSFPGFYTVLDESEGLTEFPLEMTKKDTDLNGEVISQDRRGDSVSVRK